MSKPRRINLPKQTRKWGNKVYNSYEVYPTMKKAMNDARALTEQGRDVRVLKWTTRKEVSYPWVLYMR